MRVLIVHNAYQHKGGEDAVVANEVQLLRDGGFDVELLEASNNNISSHIAAARAAISSIYSWGGRKLVANAIKRFRPHVMHVHNFFPLLSPSIFDAARVADVPTVWTLHNFRMTCANGLLFRDGGTCEKCIGKGPIPAVIHRCYRGSLVGSAAVATSIAAHKARGTWNEKVTRFIALNEFARQKFVAAGLPADRIVIKPNFAPDPGAGTQTRRSGFVYVGRLSTEKGVRTLIDAFRHLDERLTIFGDGPNAAALRVGAPNNVTFAGHRGGADIQAALRQASALIVPSIWCENFPMVLVESFACGTPVIASRRGALPTIVAEGVSGLLFEAGDAESLSGQVRLALRDPELLRRMGVAARAQYEASLTPQRCLQQLATIYEDVRMSMKHAAAPRLPLASETLQ